MPNSFTDLNIAAGVFDASEYATRGLTQTLDPIDATAQARRTVNGTLIDISHTQFRKYKSTISCEDHLPPALDGVWPGQTITVDCVHELSYLTAGGSPAKTVVAGSSRTEQDFTFYRPQITFLVLTFSTSMEEYEAACSWTLELEEV